MKLKLSDWAHIAEIIGGIAIIASLIFVGVQIQENSRAVRSATFQASTDSDLAVLEPMVNDPDLAFLYNNYRDEPGSLTPQQLGRVAFLIVSMFRQFENVFEQYQAGTLPESRWLSSKGVLENLIKTPGGYCFFTGSRNGRNMISALKLEVIDPMLEMSEFKNIPDFCPVSPY